MNEESINNEPVGGNETPIESSPETPTTEFDIQSAVDEIGSSLFGKKNETPGEEVETKQETQTQEPSKEETTTLETPTPETPMRNAPSSWRPEAAKHFNFLNPEVQEEILKREEDIFRGLETYKEAATFAKNINKIIDPYRASLQQYNIAPEAQIEAMLRTHHTLAFGTQAQKAEILRNVIQGYGVDIDHLISDNTSEVDPRVQSLEQELASIKNQMAQQREQESQTQIASIRATVEAFCNDPKNIYVNELANDIVTLLKSGVSPTIEDAYNRAIWLNPSVREKELAKQQAQSIKKSEEKIKEIKRATAPNLKVSQKSGQEKSKPKTVTDTLNDTYDLCTGAV